MDLVLVVLIVLAVAAVIGGLFAGRRKRQGPQPRFEGDARQGDLGEDPPNVPPDPGGARPGGPDPD